MKRNLSKSTSILCEENMEELNIATLSQRKESSTRLTDDKDGNIIRHTFLYPLALVLRLRVLQIVCGISSMVMGSVAFIEERQKFNLGLGVPAGGLSIIAAAVSIHTSRGLVAATGGAGTGVAKALWIVTSCLLLGLMAQCCKTVLEPPGTDHSDGPSEDDSRPSSRDLFVIACLQMTFAMLTLLSAVVCARIDSVT